MVNRSYGVVFFLYKVCVRVCMCTRTRVHVCLCVVFIYVWRPKMELRCHSPWAIHTLRFETQADYWVSKIQLFLPPQLGSSPGWDSGPHKHPINTWPIAPLLKASGLIVENALCNCTCEPYMCLGGLRYFPFPTSSSEHLSQRLFPGTGEFAVCETCRLGRGKCRTVCLENEKIAGRCKLNFFCCRERTWTHQPSHFGPSTRTEWMSKARSSVASRGPSECGSVSLQPHFCFCASFSF